MSSTWLWFVSRAGGIVSLALLTVVVTLGVGSAGGRRPSVMTVGLHRSLGVGLVVFVLVHVATCVVDSYVPLGWISVVVPFAASYRGLWVGVGALAFDVLAAVLITSVLRHRLPAGLWRAVHWLSYALAAAAVVHGVAMAGADQPVLLAITVGCGATTVAATGWRLLRRSPDRVRRSSVRARGWT